MSNPMNISEHTPESSLSSQLSDFFIEHSLAFTYRKFHAKNFIIRAAGRMGEWAVGDGRWAMGEWVMGDGRWTMGGWANRRWAMGNGPWVMMK